MFSSDIFNSVLNPPHNHPEIELFKNKHFLSPYGRLGPDPCKKTKATLYILYF